MSSLKPGRQNSLDPLVGDDLSRDELLHDLVGAAVDGLHLGVDVGLADGVLPHVTPASVQLHALVSRAVLQVRHPVDKKGIL